MERSDGRCAGSAHSVCGVVDGGGVCACVCVCGGVCIFVCGVCMFVCAVCVFVCGVLGSVVCSVFVCGVLGSVVCSVG